jgi:hypothetical protein
MEPGGLAYRECKEWERQFQVPVKGEGRLKSNVDGYEVRAVQSGVELRQILESHNLGRKKFRR